MMRGISSMSRRVRTGWRGWASGLGCARHRTRQRSSVRRAILKVGGIAGSPIKNGNVAPANEPRAPGAERLVRD